jgi:hypothetical protein
MEIIDGRVQYIIGIGMLFSYFFLSFSLVWEKAVPLHKVSGKSTTKIFFINFINSFNCVHQYTFFSFSSKGLINWSIKLAQQTNRKSFLANCKRWDESLTEHFIFGSKKCQEHRLELFFEVGSEQILIR